MIAFLLLLKKSAPGLHGIPNTAWKLLAWIDIILSCFFDLLVAFTSSSGKAIPNGFNSGVFVFIPQAI